MLHAPHTGVPAIQTSQDIFMSEPNQKSFLIIRGRDPLHQVICNPFVECLRKRGHSVREIDLVSGAAEDWDTINHDFIMWFTYDGHFSGPLVDGGHCEDRFKRFRDSFLSSKSKKIFFWLQGADPRVAESDHIDYIFNPLKIGNATHQGRIRYLSRGVPEYFRKNIVKSPNPSMIFDIDYSSKAVYRSWPFAVEETLRTLKRLKENTPDLTLYKIGNLSDDHESYSHIFDGVSGKVPPAALAEIFKKSWIYITSHRGSYENSVIESQVSGCYVVSVNGVVRQELYKENETGEKSTVENLYSCLLGVINRIKSEPDLSTKISNSGWERFNYDNFIDKDFLKVIL